MQQNAAELSLLHELPEDNPEKRQTCVRKDTSCASQEYSLFVQRMKSGIPVLPSRGESDSDPPGHSDVHDGRNVRDERGDFPRRVGAEPERIGRPYPDKTSPPGPVAERTGPGLPGCREDFCAHAPCRLILKR